MNNINVKAKFSSILKFVLPLIVIFVARAGVEAQAPPNSVFCANDFEACAFEGEREVIYGANGVFVRKVIKGGSVCLPATFGVPDPVPNVLKSCYVVNSPAGKVVRDTANTPVPARVTRTVVVKNRMPRQINALIIDGRIYSESTPDGENTSYLEQVVLNSAETKSLGTQMRPFENQDFQLMIVPSEVRRPFFVATFPKTAKITDFCYEVSGNDFIIDVKTCDGSPKNEQSYILLKNEGGYNSSMKLTYYPRGGSTTRAMATGSTSIGMHRKVYLPLDADTTKPMTLTVRADARGENFLTRSVTLNDFDSVGTTCYKSWGSIATPKVSPCTLDANARKIKFWNNAGFAASLTVTYYDKDAAGKDVSRGIATNTIEVMQTETIAVPMGTSTKPVMVTISRDVAGGKNYYYHVPVRADFTGELCYKAEGVAFAPTASTCDNTIGDTTNPNTRQIRFQNDAGFDAQMIISYFVDEVINGVKMPMPKMLATGMINGLGAKYRVATIPKYTSNGIPITIAIQGSTTLRNDIFSTTLPANFAASPQPCFKVWGTLFDPKGGKCDQ